MSRAVAVLASIGFVASAVASGAAAQISPQERNWEVQVGQQTYMEYMQRGEIVPRQSQLYGILDPIGNAVAAVADREYYAPFRFILLNDPEPNAFSMPGGNVYVTTGMLSILRNRDELAGVICHEVNHDIHHDMYNVYHSAQGGGPSSSYERAVEIRADQAGAYTCAEAGFNPWGMVWNMRLHRGMEGAQGGADHPSDDQRLADLTALLTRDRAAFGRFRDDIAAATPLSNGHVYAQSGYGAYGNHAQYPSQYPSQSQQQYPSQYQQPQYPSQYQRYPQQYQQYPSQHPSQYQQPQYPSQYQQYPSQYPSQYPQYPSQYPQQNSSQGEPQTGPYPPPPLPPCYPNC